MTRRLGPRSAKEAVPSHSTGTFVVGVLSTMATGVAARFGLRPYVFEKGWQNPDVVWNPMAHIPVVTDTMFFVGAVGFAVNLIATGGDVLRSVSNKTASIVGGVALASGLVLNSAVEIPAVAGAVGIDQVFHYHAGQMDELVWGDAASIVTAGALTLSMRQRGGDMQTPS